MSEAQLSASTPTNAASKTHRHGWIRSNIEAFTVAIVMALAIKQFAFEAFQVPTESMEPTIIGRTPGGDRIIVNKFCYLFREPQRWDVVVFKYPLSRLVNYVKRLIGLPGELVRISHGDIYAGSGPDSLKITRKPSSVQDALFLANPVIPKDDANSVNRRTFWDYWQRPQSDAARIREDRQVLEIDGGAGELLIQSRIEGGVTPLRLDPKAPGRKGTRDQELKTVPVGDVRFEVDVTPGSSARTIVMRILDGTQPAQPLRLELAMDQSGSSSKLQHGQQDVTPQSLKTFKLMKDEEVELRFENVDDRVTLHADDDLVFTYDYVQAPTNGPTGQTQVAFGVSSGKAVFHRAGLFRDIYYTLYDEGPGGAPPKQDFVIPADHFLFFGDNSPNSLDARAFRVVGVRMKEDGKVLLGDLEAVADDLDAPRQLNNPYLMVDGKGNILRRDVHFFRDIQGNLRELKAGSYELLDLSATPEKESVAVLELHETFATGPDVRGFRVADVNMEGLPTLLAHPMPHAFVKYSQRVHFVRRDAIMGRANLVFLPGEPNIFSSLFALSKYRVIR